VSAYYNERDPFAAQWLRNLIRGGHIAPGEVDERSITEIHADDLRGFDQCHFFAGIGVWSHALRRAGWADSVPVWTGSCPCQPFSAAGKQAGFADERHLWPVWFRLIAECRPAIVLGEQVASALDWLDLVSADLEGSGYAFGASDLCAAGFGGAHIRQRLFFVAVADAAGERQHRLQSAAGTDGRTRAQDCGRDSGVADGLVDADDSGTGKKPGSDCQAGEVTARELRADDGSTIPLRASATGGLADANSGGRGFDGQPNGEPGAGREVQQRRDHDGRGANAGGTTDAPLLGRHPADWLFCRDGKWRPVESGTFPLADAAPGRVGRLRAYGNALDAETAAEFCGAVAEALAHPQSIAA
jgi:DNA (cytosine-5)-methyltransferase 1